MINNNYPQGGSPRSGAIQNLAMVISIIATLVCAPLLGNFTENWASKIIIESYSAEYLEIGLFVWKALIYALVYYAAQAFLVGAIVSLLLAIASRLPMFVP